MLTTFPLLQSPTTEVYYHFFAFELSFSRLIFMAQQIRELKLLEQLIDEWIVEMAMKTSKAMFFLVVEQ
jgi:hypothetical protein